MTLLECEGRLAQEIRRARCISKLFFKVISLRGCGISSVSYSLDLRACLESICKSILIQSLPYTLHLVHLYFGIP